MNRLRNGTWAGAVAIAACATALSSGCSSADSSDPVGTSEDAVTSVDKTAYDFFVGKGLKNFQAAGVVGNLIQESNVDPAAVQPNGVGHGIAQWSEPGRWNTDGGDNVIAYAASHGQSPLSLQLQLEFVWFELTTFPHFGLAQLRASTNVTEATLAFETLYEECGNCEDSNRITYAKQVLSAYGSDPTPSTELDEMAFQANTGSLWTIGSAGERDWHLGMYGETSPSIAPVRAGYMIAFEANTSRLWTAGSWGPHDTGLQMRPGTSPSIAGLTDGGYAIAFQAHDTSLYTAGSIGDKNWHLGMKGGTSPSITMITTGGYEVAFQANTGDLWTAGTRGVKDWRLGMKAGTSPAIIALPNGGYEIAFQANTGKLWTVGYGGNRDWNLPMEAGTSPSITALPGGHYEVAFQGTNGSLWTAGTNGVRDWELGMKRGTSPHIHADAKGNARITFQANTGSLWIAGADGTKSLGRGMKNGSSPSGT